MDRYTILVDAGYFFAAGAKTVSGKQTLRKQIALTSPAEMLADLARVAAPIVGNLQILRVYWYDAIPGTRPTLEQTNLAMLPGIKLRLGALNSVGEQKGVDSLIVTDLIDLARNRAIVDAILVSGDEDLRIAVQVAQSFGVRVHILAAGNPLENVNPELKMEADSVHKLDAEWFTKHLTIQAEQKAVQATASPASKATVNGNIENAAAEVIGDMLQGMTPENLGRLADHLSTNKNLPPEIDGPLIARTAGLVGRRFEGPESRQIRGQFIRAVRAKTATAK